MIRRTFNLIASAAGFGVGAIYLFSDGTSITANVVGASGSVAGVASLIGVVMIISAIGLFIVTAHHIDDREVSLEKLLRRTNTATTQESTTIVQPLGHTSQVNTHKVVHHKKK